MWYVGVACGCEINILSHVTIYKKVLRVAQSWGTTGSRKIITYPSLGEGREKRAEETKKYVL